MDAASLHHEVAAFVGSIGRVHQPE